MKRHILPMLAVGCLVLAACERDETNARQDANLKKFEQAFQLIERGNSGTVVEPGATLPSEGEPILPTDIQKYRQEKQAKASELLESLQLSGEPNQQAAAKLLVSHTQTSAAMDSARQASSAWASQAVLLSRLTADASAIRLNSRMASDYAGVDFSKAITQAQSSLESKAQEREGLARDVGDLEKKIQAFQARLDQLDQTRQAKVSEADTLSRRAFTAKGRLRYDLYVQASQATKEADNAIAQSDLIKAEMAVENAKLKVEQTRLAGANELVEALEETVKSLRDRATKTAELGQAADTRATGLRTEFDANLKQLMAVQGDRVEPAFEAALAKMAEAIENAEAAASSATGNRRGDLELNALATRAELGHFLRNRIAVTRDYQQHLQSLATLLEGEPGDRVSQIQQAAAAADQRIQEAQAKAKEAFDAAAVELDKLAEAAKTGGDKTAEQIVLRHLIPVNLALTAVTGQPEFADKATQQSQRLVELATGS